MNSRFHISTGFVKKAVIVVAVIAAAFAVFAVIQLLMYSLDDSNHIEGAGMSPTAMENEYHEIVDSSGDIHIVDDNIDAILLLGIDKYRKDALTGTSVNNQQADVILLCVLDHNLKEYTIVQIDRDTMTKFDALGATGGTYETEGQLALSHAYGTGGSDSCYNTLRAVEYLFYDINIEHYASIKLDAVSVMNDAVDGVEVELLDDFTMIDSSMTKGATVTLVGEQATRYIRERGALEDSSNTSRMERQRQYMTAWRDTFFAKRAEDEELTVSMYNDIQEFMISNIDIYELEEFVDCFDTYHSNGFVVPEGTMTQVTQGGETHMQFHVDDAALRELVIDLFCVSDSGEQTISSVATTTTTAPTEAVAMWAEPENIPLGHQLCVACGGVQTKCLVCDGTMTAVCDYTDPITNQTIAIGDPCIACVSFPGFFYCETCLNVGYVPVS